MDRKISPIFVVTIFLYALLNTLNAQSLNGYAGIWNVQTPGALFRKLTIMPAQQNPSGLDLTLWYPCPEGLCAIPDINAEVVGGSNNNLLVADVQFPGKPFSFPLVIYQSSISNILHVRVKQDVDHTQLFTFTKYGKKERNKRPIQTQSEPNPSQLTEASPRQKPVRPESYSSSSTPEVYREETESSTLISEASNSDPFASFSEEEPEVLESPGKVVLPHCFSCPSYQLRVSSKARTHLVDPKISSSRRWECELPTLPPGEYTLEVILKRGSSEEPPPPYQSGNIQIGGEEQEYLTLVLQRS